MAKKKAHKKGCKCVACSPETRRKGMAALKAYMKKGRKRVKNAFTKPGRLVAQVFRKAPKELKRKVTARRFIAKHIKRHKKSGMKQKQAVAAALSEARRKKLINPRKNPPPYIGSQVGVKLAGSRLKNVGLSSISGGRNEHELVLSARHPLPLGAKLRAITYHNKAKALRAYGRVAPFIHRFKSRPVVVGVSRRGREYISTIRGSSPIWK